MNRIVGKVLVRETGIGVPNLLVVAYDRDSSCLPDETAFASRSILESSAPHGFRGDRLGSVLTDEAGAFEITYADADFQSAGGEKRPDLVLFVLAPEDPRSAQHPAPPAPAERVLYFSPVPRVNAGRTESYLIRIQAAELKRAGVSHLEGRRSPIPDQDETVAVLDASFALEDAVRDRIDRRIATRVARLGDVARKTRQAFDRFYPSAVSPKARADPTYLMPGDDLRAAQREILKRDIDRLGAVRPKRTFRLRMTSDEMKEAGFTVGEDGTVSGRLALDAVLRRMKASRVGTELFVSHSPLQDCRAEHAAQQRLEVATSPAPENPPAVPASAGGEPGSAWTAETLVADMLGRQMAHVTGAEVPPAIAAPPRAQPGDVAGAIASLELRSGPADVTAYHDFYDLQIAFEHVWTEIFDGRLGDDARAIYGEWVKLKEAWGLEDADDEAIETEADLRRLLDQIRAMGDQIAAETAPPGKQPAYMYAMRRDRDGRPPAHEPRPEPGGQDQAAPPATPPATPPPPAVDEAARRRLTSLQQLLSDLADRLAEPHRFDVFAPDSVNFGVLVTYRQEWKPMSFQVGELVSTIPLAPKEVRRYSKKRVVKRSRSDKEIENALRIRQQEASNTARVDAEIVDRAVNKTNFKATAEGGVKLGVLNLSAQAALDVDAERASSQTKRDFREAVLKSAEEYKQEHRLEIETTESVELDEESSGEIANPNDEIPVTYLLYELQRRYEVREKIDRVTPVILVANDVPAPHEIDADWLIAHDWILRRVILDDSFLPALEFLSKSLVGAEFSLEVLRANVDRQARLVEGIQQQVSITTRKMAGAFQTLQQSMAAQAGAVEEDEAEGFFESIGEGLFGETDGESAEAERVRTERAKAAFDLLQRETQELRARLNSETTALQAATDAYTKALQEHLNRRTEIARLRIHVKDNILYYMQAIWAHEPPDQRFFRLYRVLAPWIGAPVERMVEVELAAGLPGLWGMFGQRTLDVRLPWNDIPVTERSLVEIADLDNLLGYKGNYMIFPLKESNYLTDYMMQDYVDDRIGLRDPDEFGNYTTDELVEHIRCVYEHNPSGFTDEVRDRYRDLVQQRLMAPRREKDEVIVPTNSLYIEALPGTYPILEDFKLMHRAIDVKKAQAEVRHVELENVRIAARLLSGEREDPEVDRLIMIGGDGAGVAVHPDA